LPRFGFGILLGTVILTSLSVPFSLRAHDLGGKTADEANLARVRGLMAELDLGGADLDQVVSPRGLQEGRHVLVSKCTGCHDMRTILVQPRTAARWLDVSWRMLEKPNPFGEEITNADVVAVTAYLVAITPDLQQSRKRQHALEEKAAAAIAVLQSPEPAPVPPATPTPVTNTDTNADTDADTDGGDEAGETGTATPPAPEPAPAKTPKRRSAAAVDEAQGRALLEAKCADCHGMEEVDAHGGDDLAGWKKVLAQMIEEGAEIDDAEAATLAAYLARIKPKP
jgi:mono/diheme cytochrome c family protein